MNVHEQSVWSVLFVVLLSFTLASCSQDLAQIQQLGQTDVVISGADVRLGYAHQVKYDEKNHRIKAERVFCAEPSPDIAEAMQHAFGFGLKGEGTHPSGVKAGVGLSLSDAEAQAVAQLGERIATIQLLRDALYRACEAYANGAFSEITYAVLLSRYDDTMLSSLFGELAAGNFGRELVKAGGTANSIVTTEPKNLETIDELTQAKEAIEQASTEADQAKAALRQAKALGETANLPALEAVDAEKKKNLQMANSQLNQAQATFVKLATRSGASGGIALSRPPNIEVAKILAKMQHNHLYGFNSDSLKVACVTAMAQAKGENASVLSDWCRNPQGPLATLVAKEGEIMEKIALQKAIQDKQVSSESGIFSQTQSGNITGEENTNR